MVWARGVGLIARLIAFAPLLMYLAPAVAAQPSADCSPAIGRIVSIQGALELKRLGDGPWIPVRHLDTILCAGDLLHTGPHSRAAVVLSPETLIRLDQRSSLQLRSEPHEVIVELYTDAQVSPDHLGKACGAGHFITRFPRKFKVLTPFLNASVEGTEFQLALACDRADLSVYEGRVAVDVAVAGALRKVLKDGEFISMGGQEPPGDVKAIVRPFDSMQWTLYYPPTGHTEKPGACQSSASPEGLACVAGQIESLLRIGRTDEAQPLIGDLLARAPLSADGLALAAIVALVKNDREQARRHATAAIAQSQNSARAWLAMSYVEQASFQLASALENARRAAAVAPESTLVQVRIAELMLSVGDVSGARAKAMEVLDADAGHSRAHAIAGFIAMSERDTEGALTHFDRAIENDSSDPLPRLGAGIAFIRKGKLAQGREQIEIAVALDPGDAQLRSYLGKAYFEENEQARDGLAQMQYEIARRLDPKDPTPDFYGAVLHQTRNDPYAALSEFEQSVRKNDNRGVFRSSFMLDDDRAAREISAARIYDTLGLNGAAISIASAAVDESPGNYSAHKLLADLYAAQDRHEIVRTSELLQSQMLQPIDVLPAAPHFAFSDVDSRGSSAFRFLTLGEYDSLFARAQPRMALGASLGPRGSWGGEASALVSSRYASIGAGYFYNDFSGYRPNSDVRHDIHNVIGSLYLGPYATLQAEYRHRDTEHGDIAMEFDAGSFAPQDRFLISQKVSRLGLTLRPTASSSILASYMATRRTDSGPTFTPFVNFDGALRDEGKLGEIRYQQELSSVAFVAGAGHAEVNTDFALAFDWTGFLGIPCLEPDFPCDSRRISTVRQSNAYLYGTVTPTPGVVITLAGSYDDYEESVVHRKRWNPKFGIRWSPTGAMHLRAAAFKALRRRLSVDQTLEPTQVAGFAQFYEDINGSESRVLALGADARLSPQVLASGEWIARESTFHTGLLGASLAAAPPQTFEEQQAKLDLLWQISSTASVSAGARHEAFDYNPSINIDIPTRLRSLEIPVGFKWFQEQGVFVGVSVTSVRQSVERSPNAGLAVGKDNFAVWDAAIGIQLPRRRGVISLECKNILDEDFSYQDNSFRAEVRLPKYLPVRQVRLKVALAF